MWPFGAQRNQILNVMPDRTQSLQISGCNWLCRHARLHTDSTNQWLQLAMSSCQTAHSLYKSVAATCYVVMPDCTQSLQISGCNLLCRHARLHTVSTNQWLELAMSSCQTAHSLYKSVAVTCYVVMPDCTQSQKSVAATGYVVMPDCTQSLQISGCNWLCHHARLHTVSTNQWL